jgi:hypothetical protein
MEEPRAFLFHARSPFAILLQQFGEIGHGGDPRLGGS